ncbi:MAG: hypothetical protein JWM91_4197 [Rhodospirillales bacterium]|nr:hypothetical protein [Rhodospirillales bacterium]
MNVSAALNPCFLILITLTAAGLFVAGFGYGYEARPMTACSTT